MLGLEKLQLHCDCLSVLFVVRMVDFAERTSGDLFGEFIVLADDYLHELYIIQTLIDRVVVDKP